MRLLNVILLAGAANLAACGAAPDGADPEADEGALKALAIHSRQVPASVAHAVETHHYIGRTSADAGGISQVRVFDVQNGTPKSVSSALRTVLLSTPVEADERATSMSHYCASEVGGEAASSATACVSEIMRKHLRKTGRAYRDVFFDIDDDFRNAGKTIDEFVTTTVGEDGREYNFCENVYSVDVCQSVLVSKNGKIVVLVDYDYGA